MIALKDFQHEDEKKNAVLKRKPNRFWKPLECVFYLQNLLSTLQVQIDLYYEFACSLETGVVFLT